MVTKTMTWKCYRLCNFWVKKEKACKQTSIYTHFVCVLECKPVCVCNCIVKSHFNGISYVYICTCSSSGVLCRSRTGLGAAPDTTLNPISDDTVPKTLAKIGFRTVSFWIAAILLYVEPFG